MVKRTGIGPGTRAEIRCEWGNKAHQMSRILYKTCGLRLYSTRVLISVGGAGTVNHSRKVLTRHSERHICLWFMGSISDVLSWDYGLLYERSLVVLLLYLSLSSHSEMSIKPGSKQRVGFYFGVSSSVIDFRFRKFTFVCEGLSRDLCA